MTVAELNERMSPDEFLSWRALSRVEAEEMAFARTASALPTPDIGSKPKANAHEIAAFMRRNKLGGNG